jgi:hypothetical protein
MTSLGSTNLEDRDLLTRHQIAPQRAAPVSARDHFITMPENGH